MTALPYCLEGIRILSLALNLPGPAALMRLRGMGARCTKVEAPPAPGARSSDPMGMHNRTAYAQLHEGMEILQLNLKTPEGQQTLQTELAASDVLLTSFRPAALRKLGVDWSSLSASYPMLNMVQIVGAAGERGDEAGHDLTYQAEAGLVQGLEMPTSLFADMAGALTASEAVLQTLLGRAKQGCGQFLEVGLFESARWMAMPRGWGMGLPGHAIGGGHAGYKVYTCSDGRVALAALEPHFFQRLLQQVLQSGNATLEAADVFSRSAHTVMNDFFAGRTCAQLDEMASAHDIPLFTMRNA